MSENKVDVTVHAASDAPPEVLRALADVAKAVLDTIRAAVKGNVAVFYPCECLEHESGYEHFVDQLTTALMANANLGGWVTGQEPK